MVQKIIQDNVYLKNVHISMKIFSLKIQGKISFNLL